jgi:hypothetical protein
MYDGSPRESYIRMIAFAESEGELREIYEKVTYPAHLEPANILRIHSQNPGALTGMMQLYLSAHKGPSPISRAQREMIATAVSTINDCFY